MDESSDLIQVMRKQFASSKRWLRYSIYCNLTVVVLSALSSIAPLGQSSTTFPILLLVVQVIAFTLREKSTRDFSFAELIRRLALLQDGLGFQLSNLQLKRIITRSNQSMDEPPYLANYYASTLPQGPGRLLEILSESCFYTENIAGRAFTILVSLVGCTSIALVFLIFPLIDAYADPLVLRTFTIAIAPFLSFWATGDLIYMALRFRTLRSDCSSILDKCEDLERTNRHDLPEILQMVDEYNCSLASSLPLPTRFYEANKANLNKMWVAQSNRTNS